MTGTCCLTTGTGPQKCAAAAVVRTPQRMRTDPARRAHGTPGGQVSPPLPGFGPGQHVTALGVTALGAGGNWRATVSERVCVSAQTRRSESTARKVEGRAPARGAAHECSRQDSESLWGSQCASGERT